MFGTDVFSRRSRRRGGAATVVVTGLLLLVVPACAQALEKGVNTDLTWGISSAEQDQTVAATQDLGARWMRLVMAWHDIEASKGSYRNLDAYDTAIAKAASSGAKVLVTVYTAPSWASGTSERESPPLHPADYADFMGFVADRYRGQVQAWELWNEQNTPGFWSTGPDPAHYARMVKAAYPAVKAANPNALVVYGGTWENDYEYLERAYAAVPNLGQYYDVMATHPFNGVDPPEHVAVNADGRIAKHSFAGYREIRRTMLEHGDNKPIWFTELGWATFDGSWGVTEAQQADFLTRAYSCANEDPYVHLAIWYALRNHPFGGDSAEWEHQLGLTRTDFSHKPSYDAFKNRAGGGDCNYDFPASYDARQLPDAGVSGVAPAAQLSSPMLAVRSALIRADRLIIDARVASSATGSMHGVAVYGDRELEFTAPIRGGRIHVRKALPGGAAQAAWIALTYERNTQFQKQWVILRAAGRSPDLQLTPERPTIGAVRSHPVRGTVSRDAHGSVLLGLAYRTTEGVPRLVIKRTRIHRGKFSASLRLPARARDARLYAVYAGDSVRGIGGSSRSVVLRRG
jgi:cellulase (glycosyl hydrolase family 5)